LQTLDRFAQLRHALQSAHPNQARLRVVQQCLSKLGETGLTHSVFSLLVAAFLAPLRDPLEDSTELPLLTFKLEDRMRTIARAHRLDVLAKNRKLHTQMSYNQTGGKACQSSESSPLLQAITSVCKPLAATKAQQREPNHEQLQVRSAEHLHNPSG
jgi:hypothetical protein